MADKDSFASLFEQARTDQKGARRHRVGDRLEVTIVAIGRDAVFAELGGKQEGVFERSALVDKDGKLAVEVGARVTATVKGLDRETGQAQLSPVGLHTAEGAVVAPPQATGPALVVGAKVKGAVTGIERFGLFVQINGTRGGQGRGLVPTADLGLPRGSDPKRHFTVGQEIEAKITSTEDGRLRLSIVALKSDEERADFEKFRSKDRKPEERSPRSLGTLGDLLAKKK